MTNHATNAAERMTPAEAAEFVKPRVFHVHQYAAVEHHDACQILGEKRFARLLKDPVRKLGPIDGTVYPWNIEAYLIQPDLRKASP